MHQVVIRSDHITEIVDRVLANCKNVLPKRRYIISLAGIPGAGKSTLSSLVAQQLNQTVKTIVLPQDGFHLYRWQLNDMPDSEEAIRRRGAPFTFNAKAFVQLISQLNDPVYSQHIINAPSFDHKLKDPIEDDIHIEPDVQVIIIEGNYVSLRDPDWRDIHQYVDESWFIQTDIEVVRDRIIKRHLAAGIANNLEEATERADGSDLANAKYILAHSAPADVVIVTP
ncbi:P-loop containing nucleoside triphosphate hydrolase protein [Scheffersomyces amazonensis]|uniref:P-loop containing nucleoside triphosphate hydrolase protein n=1 Tax=Scheffersomyces amazonensis TaxID=1078765 RepID=UPI00315CB5B3